MAEPETAHAGPGLDDDTTVLPDLTPTEHVALAWSDEQPELDFDDGADNPPTTAPVAPQSRARQTKAALVALWVFMAAALLYGWSKDDSAGSPPSSAAPPTASPTVKPHETMPGDGTYNMGGIDGKSWGVWESSGGPADNCQWSIRAVSRYTPGELLDSGAAGMGQRARVNIQPLPYSSALTGEAHGFQVVFMTNGCGSWWLVG